MKQLTTYLILIGLSVLWSTPSGAQKNTFGEERYDSASLPASSTTVFEGRSHKDAPYHAVVRHLITPPEFTIDVLQVSVRAGPIPITGPEQRPCYSCAAQHFFILPSPRVAGKTYRLRAMRHAVGEVSYLHDGGTEYLLRQIKVGFQTQGIKLYITDLKQTGFLPFKSRLKIGKYRKVE